MCFDITMAVKKILFLLALFLFLFLLPSEGLALETKVSIKKGVGNAMNSYCDGNADKAGCNAKIADLLKKMGITWYYSWYTDMDGGTKFGDIEYVPMAGGGAYTSAQIDWFKVYANRHRGSYWLIWNEPDYYRQGNLLPADAAKIYKPLRDAIKSKDPNAKLIVGGMAWGWEQWAGNFVAEYKKLNGGVGPEVEGWHGHLYTCKEATKDEYDINGWRLTITRFRDWINRIGGGVNKEFWLTEFGCLNYDRDQIIKEQLDWIENYDGLQRYAWFVASSIAAGSGFNGGNLFVGTPDKAGFGLSALGQTYAQYPLNPKPIPTRSSSPTVSPSATPFGTATPSPTTTPLSTPTPSPSVPGDTNNNSCVGARDLGFVYGHYQTSLQCTPTSVPLPLTSSGTGDFNHDGCVDDLDLSVVSSRFSYNCNE